MAWRFVRARHFRKGRSSAVRLVVVHTMEAPETPSTAETVAAWFARTDRPVSAHFCVDEDSVVQCVRVADTAYAAPGANHDGVQIELAGRAAQDEHQWRDASSDRTLTIAACVAAELIVGLRFFGASIPVVRLSAEEVAAGRPGLCGHVEVSRAYGRSQHWDPGPAFPWEDFLARTAWWLPRIDRIDWI